MQFRASLKVQTRLHRIWTGRRLRRLTINGVPFHFVGQRYISVDDPLSADDVAALSLNNQVQLEMSSTTTPQVEIIDPVVSVEPTPVPEQKPAAQPLSLPPSNKMKVDLRTPPRGYQGNQRHR